MATLERAIAIAAGAHAGQVDKAGAPYILHPLRVMMRLSDTERRIVAMLHDVLEDCPGWTARRLVEDGFSDAVVVAVDALTKRQDEDYFVFVRRCAADPIARDVKRADIADNLDTSRLGAHLSATDEARVRKYRKALEILDEADVSARPRSL